ncbi:uncharacterized protein B0I36DRAFT_360572 [Microdochium trichocladiopsis]|uniref:WIBG Mago-binding domain-containing protein n=1 Tax=Microdochium trichocladiopsis TaxID=1682393 RepID=A0A9P8YDY0_9PEZI|nr:uncharacterized protein B0I36DRAFT_360572 [Microdochium trichocladiopsis]KAH7035157.1 hypothetical protein B0I36DRAFT_360572 [Microdochium trichocladiopsis]
MPSEPTKSGIVTDETSGDRHIPESVRADGSTRKAIKIRPGYRPPEDVELYKNRTAEGFRNRGKTGGVIGAEGLKKAQPAETPAASAASNKNAKRREARKKAKESDQPEAAPAADSKAVQAEEVDPEVEREKKARNLRKKLKQARDLKDKKEGGEALLPEQIAKVIKINELVRELAALGFDAEGEPTTSTDGDLAEKPKDG